MRVTVCALPAHPVHWGPMRVSVVLATYNGARFVAAQLDTLVAQTLAPYEVIVSDDCSEDSTVEIVESYSGRLPLRISRNTSRLGYGDNFLAGVALASGEVVAFCDQDDLWSPEKLERCVREFSDEEVALIIHAARVVDVAGNPIDRLWPEIRRDQRLARGELNAGQWVGMAMMFRRSVVDGVRAADRPSALFGHDHWVAYLGSCRGVTRLIADPLADYRLHSDNACGIFEPATRSIARIVRGAGSVLYLEQSRTFDERAQYLLRLADLWAETEPRSAAAAHHLADVQTRLAREREVRARLYAATSLLQRLVAFSRVLRSGGYRRAGYEELGGRALAKDACQVLTGKVARG